MRTEPALRSPSRRSDQLAKGDRRELALLDAAEALLKAGTYATASVGDLAQAAGISRAAFYFYFGSKEDLLASVVDRAVQGFNEQISVVLEPTEGVDAASALRASVEAAGELWWNHHHVLLASVDLGTRVPDVYERTQDNLAIVRRPTVALLLRHGRVAESMDPVEADALVLALTLLAERNFYHLMRSSPSRDDLERAIDRIARIWLRAFGLEGMPGSA